MSEIKDINLAPSGADKIAWVASYMPILNSIKAEFERTKPFRGKKDCYVDPSGSQNRIPCQGLACGWRRGVGDGL